MAKEPVLAPTVTTWIAPAHDHSAPAEVVEVVVEDVAASE
jgi:hypothetical protein